LAQVAEARRCGHQEFRVRFAGYGKNAGRLSVVKTGNRIGGRRGRGFRSRFRRRRNRQGDHCCFPQGARRRVCHPRFYFVADAPVAEGAIPFDMFGAEFTHHGEDCTFETLLKRFDLLEIKGLREIAEIVHDIDLKDDKFHKLEAAGMKSIIDGLSIVLRDDRKLMQQTSIIFDGLYGLLSGESQRKSSVKMRSRKRSRTK
jgi:hypothetical protein